MKEKRNYSSAKNMAKIIIGVAGEMGSGKEAISQYLVEKYHSSSHNFSQVLTDIAKRLYLPITRETQTAISGMIRTTFGQDIMAKVMANESKEDSTEIVVVQGIRRPQDMDQLRELPNFKLIYVEADIVVRYGRVKKRGEKENDATMTFEQFQHSHTYETELAIAGLKEYAAHVVKNDGTMEQLHKQVDEIIAQYVK